MPGYADIYVLAKDRSVQSVEQFLDTFLPKRAHSAMEYELPQYSDTPEDVYPTPLPVLQRCASDPSLEYLFYWRAINHSKIEHAMVIFLNDGKVVYGVSTAASDKDFVMMTFDQMQAYLGTTLGFISYEHCPDFTTLAEFKAHVKIINPKAFHAV